YAGPVARAAHGVRRVHRPLVLASVEADRSHRYPVEIAVGLLERLPRPLAGMFPAARMVVLTDDAVLERYGACLLEELRGRGVEAAPLLLPAGERSKSAGDYLRL